MSTRLLICDDSNMARKQVARSLPAEWDVDVSFATNGQEAIEAIKEGKGDVLLLDLNMPVMDGYEVLEAIVKQDLPTMTIVISGDVQPEAHQRVTSMGALDFIHKPINKDKLTQILLSYGIFTKEDIAPAKSAEAKVADTKPSAAPLPSVSPEKVSLPNVSVAKVVEEAPEERPPIILEQDLRDCYQEIANVAMGRAGDLLARLLDVFVLLPDRKSTRLNSSH